MASAFGVKCIGRTLTRVVNPSFSEPMLVLRPKLSINEKDVRFCVVCRFAGSLRPVGQLRGCVAFIYAIFYFSCRANYNIACASCSRKVHKKQRRGPGKV